MGQTQYHDIVADVALRAEALTGAQATALQAAWATRPLTSALFQSAKFPFSSILQSVQFAEETFAVAIADTPNHPWRTILLSNSPPTVLDESAIPAVDGNAIQIIGKYGDIYSVATGESLSEQPRQRIRRRNNNPGSFWKGNLNGFHIEGNRMYHSAGVTGVRIECCVYNRSTQQTAIANNNAMLLPDVLAPALMCEAVSLLTAGGRYADQALLYRRYAEEVKALIRSRSVDIQPLPPSIQKPDPING